MIQTVEKKYNPDNTIFYLVTYQDGEETKKWLVPHSETNRHYKEILEWVAEGNTITDNGGGE
tara:strand:+ start:336 stop:521 length:186 start_codon:yes stop_codon:yes gene_type:complete